MVNRHAHQWRDHKWQGQARAHDAHIPRMIRRCRGKFERVVGEYLQRNRIETQRHIDDPEPFHGVFMRHEREQRHDQRRERGERHQPDEHDPRTATVGERPRHQAHDACCGVLHDDPGQQAGGVAAEPIPRKGLIVRKEHEHGGEAGRHDAQPHEWPVAAERLPPRRDALGSLLEQAANDAPRTAGADCPGRLGVCRLVKKHRCERGQREERSRRGEDFWEAVGFRQPRAQEQGRGDDGQHAAHGHAHHHRAATVPGRDELALQGGEHQLIQAIRRREEGIEHEEQHRQQIGPRGRERRPCCGEQAEAGRHRQARQHERPFLAGHTGERPRSEQRRHTLAAPVEHRKQAA